MRKCYLVILFVFLVVFWAGCAFIKPYHAKTEANMKLISFPEKIPGAYKVLKFIEPGAKYCLVHLFDMHFARDLTSVEYKIIRATQQDNYHILRYLVSKISLERVYKEGRVLDLDKIEQLIKERANALQEFLDSNKIKFPREIELEAKSRTAKYFSEQKEYFKEIDAVNRLEKEGLLIGYPAEMAISSFRHWGLVYFSELREVIEDYERLEKEAEEERENVVLDIICYSQNTLAVVVYGAGHNLGDNIDEWNNKNPSDKFSLIIVIPESLKPYIKLN